MTLGPLANCLPELRRSMMIQDNARVSDGQLLGEFIRKQDDAAFAALVKRHAAMVFGVCRRMIGDIHLAEDAFQAVFLVLARRAAVIRPREQVGNWLHGVAYRTALKSRMSLARHRSREKQVSAMLDHPLPPAEVWHDVQPILDEEIARLPEKLRVPVVLCDLEGRTQRAVARELKIPPATLANRLASARRLLAERLNKRGIFLSGGALAAAIAANVAQASAPALLVSSTARAGNAIVHGKGLAGLVSTHSIQLSEGVMTMMFLGKIRMFISLLAISLFMAGGFGLALASSADEEALPRRSESGAIPASEKNLPARNDDREFLKRACLKLRGTFPTDVEIHYFCADSDTHKRSKVVEWLMDNGELKYLKTDVHNENTWENSMIGTQMLLGAFKIQTAAPDRLTQLRRVYLDLTGVTPSKPELKEFVDEKSLESNEKFASWLLSNENHTEQWDQLWIDVADISSDEDFIRRACQESRGTPSTHVEFEYFKADKDPKKREIFLDMLLKDPIVAKKLGEDWKQKMLHPAALVERFRPLIIGAIPNTETVEWAQRFRPLIIGNPTEAWSNPLLLKLNRPEAFPERLERLLDQLLKSGRNDDQMIDSLATAVLGRLPTESEKKLVLTNISKATDRRTAWSEVLQTFASTEESKQHGSELNPQGPKPK